jgi:flagellar FliJ protein
MAFYFSLQPLLRVRHSFEKRERQRLVMLASAVAQVRQQLDETRQMRDGIFTRLESELLQGSSAAELHLENIAISQMAERQKTLQAHRERLEQQMVHQQAAYARAQKDRKIIENLRAQQFAAYQSEALRREQQSVDDLYNLRNASRPDGSILPSD